MKSLWYRFRTWFLGGFVVLAVGAVILFFWNGQQDGQGYEVYVVERGSIDQSVEVTGTLEPAASIDLSFQRSGQVKGVYVEVGARVEEGELLAELENEDEAASLSQAKASLQEAQADLNLQLADERDEDRAIAEADVAQAEAQLEKARVDVENGQNQLENVKLSVGQDIAVAELALEDAKIALEKVKEDSATGLGQDAVSVASATVGLKTAISGLLSDAILGLQKVDLMFGFIVEETFLAEVITGDGRATYLETKQLLLDNRDERSRLEEIFLEFSATPTEEDFLSMFEALTVFNKDMQTMMLKGIQTVNDPSLESYYTPTLLSGVRTEISSAQTSVNSAISDYESAKGVYEDALLEFSGADTVQVLDVESAELLVLQRMQELEKAKVEGDIRIDDAENSLKALGAEVVVRESALLSARAALDKLVADPRDVDVGPFRARVSQASARVAQEQSVFNKTLLKAPVSGVVTTRDIEFGELVQGSGTAAGSESSFQMIDDSAFHIEVDVPETQINKLNEDSAVTLIFDSLGKGELFDGDIVLIEPGSTEIDGIVYFKVKVALAQNDQRLKAGMTAQVMIGGVRKEDVVIIPEVAIVVEDGRKWVTVLLNDESEEERIEVRTGVRGKAGMIEVVSGLEAGQRILVPKTI